MNKEDIQIVVVPTEKIFPDGEQFEGFLAHEDRDITSIILDSFHYMRRGDAEVDPNFKQPIGYAVIRNLDGDIFLYQRGSKRQEFHESRLAGKWACGIGGHIEAEDEETGDILTDSLLRELEEEVTLDGNILSVEPIGYINSLKDEVSEVHIGILYVITTDAQMITGSEEVVNEKFYPLSQIQDIIDDPEKEVEEWTRIVINHICS